MIIKNAKAKRALQNKLAPRMQKFLEWAMGMDGKVWDRIPKKVTTEWKKLVRDLPR